MSKAPSHRFSRTSDSSSKNNEENFLSVQGIPEISRGTIRFLGWFSVGLGLAEMIAPRTVARWCGLPRHDFLPLYGLREIASGVGILNSKKPATWLWSRVAGDGQDLATLCEAMDDVNCYDRAKLCTALLAVTGVTVLDTLAAAQQSINAGR